MDYFFQQNLNQKTSNFLQTKRAAYKKLDSIFSYNFCYILNKTWTSAAVVAGGRAVVAIGQSTSRNGDGSWGSGRCLQKSRAHGIRYNGKGGKLDTAKPKEIAQFRCSFVRAVWQIVDRQRPAAVRAVCPIADRRWCLWLVPLGVELRLPWFRLIGVFFLLNEEYVKWVAGSNSVLFFLLKWWA